MTTVGVTEQNIYQLLDDVGNLRVAITNASYLQMVTYVNTHTDTYDSFNPYVFQAEMKALGFDFEYLSPSFMESIPLNAGIGSTSNMGAYLSGGHVLISAGISSTSNVGANITTGSANNLLDLNIANGSENGFIPGSFGDWYPDSGSTMESSTEQAWQGSRSVKVTCPLGSWGGFFVYLSSPIYVNPSQPYTFSTYIKETSGDDDFQLRLIEFNQWGEYISESDYNFNATSSWARYEVARTMSSQGYYASVQVINVGNEATTYYVDGLQVEAGSSATTFALPYYTAQNKMSLNVANGSESGSITNLYMDGGGTLTSSTSEAYSGSRSQKFVASDDPGDCRVHTTDAAAIAISGSSYNVFSLYTKCSSNDGIYLGFRYLNSSKEDIGWNWAEYYTIADTWVRQQFFDVAPVDAAYIAPYMADHGGEGTTYYLDCWQLEDGTACKPYVSP